MTEAEAASGVPRPGGIPAEVIGCGAHNPEVSMAGDGRSYVSGYFVLDLDGFKCGLIQKFEGGDIEGDVTNLPMAHDYYVKKHIGNVKYHDFALQLSLSMGQPVKDWIDASLAMNALRRSGEIKIADVDRKVQEVREFSDALLTEIGFPACDGGAKDAAFLSLKFSPWIVRNKKGDGSILESPVDADQKTFTTHNFNLSIDGIDAAAKVSRVDAIEIKQTVVRDNVGNERAASIAPGKLTFSNITITLAEADAGEFVAWHADFVINGNNEESQHKTGSLVYLDATRQKELLRLEFSGLGISTITPAPRGGPEDTIAKVRVTLPVKRINVKF
jgi:hypothetical protein